MTEICKAITACRICGSTNLSTVIDLGEQYIASIFVKGEVPAALNRRYPLEVVRCSEGCGLVQLRHSIEPQVMYDNYGYRSGTNEIMRANLRDIAAKAEALVGLKEGDTVLDIGCNDGTLLVSYQTEGLDKIGIDPSENVVQHARAKGLDVVNDFFSADAYRAARGDRKARVVTSIAMFYDLEAPRDFVRDVASILAPDGVWVIELSYLPSMLEKHSYDTVCHEHLEYYSLRQIEWMVEEAGLAVHKVELNDSNGGSFRLFMRPVSAGKPSAADERELHQMRAHERELGLDSDSVYNTFREASARARDELRGLLQDLRDKGKKTFIYGASTKGNTILQYCGVDRSLVELAADRNSEKWGAHTLGTDIPIVSEEEARSQQPDYFLVLPWHFFEGFIGREADFLSRGGQFILPLPSVRTVAASDKPIAV